jgi:ADP-ribose pyrophosphatase YjhB (NUDIX family)
MSTFGVNIIIRDNDKVLLIHRSDFDIWALPGGGIDDGESVEESAIRETLEETGLTVKVEKLLGLYSIPKWRLGGDYCVLLECSVISGTLKKFTEETRDCRYFPVAALPAAI